MQTDFLAAIQLQPPLSSGNESKAFCGNLNSGDTEFDSILKGILGSSTASVSPPKENASRVQPDHPLQDLKPYRNTSGEMNVLQGILQKLAAALRQQKKALNAEELNSLLQNILADDELAFLKQFVENSALHASVQHATGDGLIPDAAFAATGGSNALQELAPLLSTTISDLSKIIQQQYSAPLADGTQRITEGKSGLSTSQYASQRDAQSQQQIAPQQNIVKLLESLRDRLQQLYAASLKQGISDAPLQKQTVPLPQASTTTAEMTEIAAPQAQQPMLQNVVVHQGKTAHPGSLQTVSAQEQPLLENTKTLTDLFQQFSSQTDTSGRDTQQQVRHFAGTMHALEGLKSQEYDSTPLALLFQQSRFGGINNNSFHNSMVNPQGIEGQAVEQPPATAQLWQKLASLPRADALLEAGALLEADREPVMKTAGTGKLFDSTALLRELIGSGDMQQTLNRTELAGRGEKTFAKTPLNSAYIIEQLLDRINAAARHGTQKLSMQLFPPELGKLHIELALHNNQLRAVVIAESSQVKQMLEANIEQLRSSLDLQNIQLDKLSVMVAGENASGFERFASHLRNQSDRDKKQGCFVERAGHLDPMMSDETTSDSTRRNIISADMVDVFV